MTNEHMRISSDPVSQALASLEMLENVQKAAAQTQVADTVKLVRLAHQNGSSAGATEDGKGQHVNVVA